MNGIRSAAPAVFALVLDGQECHALAAVRSLGRHGVRVSVASSKPDAMSFYSRYCSERLRAPAPTEADAYAAWLLESLRARRYDALLFFGEASVQVVAQHRDAIRSLTGCPLPPPDVFQIADRKDLLLRLAQDVGVPAPATYRPRSLDEVAALSSQLQFPVIVKAVHGSGGRQVARVDDPAALVAAVNRVASSRTLPADPLPLVQEFIPGRGYGLTALFDRGQPRAVFMHRRLAEHDVARGVALAHATTGAESVDEPQLRESGLRLLRALEWDGVAMVEFRRSSRDGRFYLMEINPRFPGSLDLAVASGADLPWLYLHQAMGRPLDPPSAYARGVRYRWLVSKGIAPAFENPRAWLAALGASLLGKTHTDLSPADPGPHYSHVRAAAWWLRTHLRRDQDDAQPEAARVQAAANQRAEPAAPPQEVAAGSAPDRG